MGIKLKLPLYKNRNKQTKKPIIPAFGAVPCFGNGRLGNTNTRYTIVMAATACYNTTYFSAIMYFTSPENTGSLV